MKPPAFLGIVAALIVGAASGQDSRKPATRDSSNSEQETRYLAFQIFTYGPDPKVASMGEGINPLARFPDKATLRDYIQDIKNRIGAVGDGRTRLAVILGHLSFDHGDAETTKFIELGFTLALETDVAVGFHIDDSMFWARRKDLWSDLKNVEALDWEGTPCTSRRLDWQTGPGSQPDAAPPQMCFNSEVVQREVRQRSALIGKAIQAGVNRLRRLNRPELFAGVIAGSETMIGQDFKTGKYLGYRALINRGFSREHPPRDLDLEREKVVQEFIDLWTKGLADAGVSPHRIYSHTAFLSRRVFQPGDNESTTYSQHNHFATPSAAFGNHHRPGFSTYPQPGLFDQIYEELAKHKQVGWASCEGTNLQLGAEPGQSGMTMETYLAKMFNHGGTLVNIFSWGIGGEANKNMDFRVVTEGEEALRAYRKFLRGEPLIEAKTEASSFLERLPAKIRKIHQELPAWIQKTGDTDKASRLMQELGKYLKAKNFAEAETTADSILRIIGGSAPAAGPDIPEQARRELTHALGGPFLVFRSQVQDELKLTQEQRAKLEQHLRQLLPDAMRFFQSIDALKPGERENALGVYRPKARANLTAALGETLDRGQRDRERQLERQQEGLFAGEIWPELMLTDEQRKQFMAVIQDMQKKIEPLIKEARSGGDPRESRLRVMKVRLDHEGRLKALLTDTQRNQWREMVGKPLELGD